MHDQFFSLAFWVGMFGMVLLQTNTFPQTIKILRGKADPKHLSLQMFVQTWLGLAAYQYNAIMTENLLYIISNSIGLCSVALIIFVIIIKRKEAKN